MDDELEALRLKMRYLPCLDDTLKAPNEIWYHEDDSTFYYLKRWGNDVDHFVMVVKVIEQVFEDFDVIKDDLDRVNSLRYGVLIYRQPLEN